VLATGCASYAVPRPAPLILLAVAAIAAVRRDDHKQPIALTVDSQRRLAFRLRSQALEVSHVPYGLAVDALDTDDAGRAAFRHRQRSSRRRKQQLGLQSNVMGVVFVQP
jgi:hypothetical protein